MISSSSSLFSVDENITSRTSLNLINSDENMSFNISFLSIDLNQWIFKAIVTEVTSTRRRFEYVIMSSFFRDTFDEMNRDHTINFNVIDEISVFEWYMSRKWKNLVVRQIEEEINEADAFKNEKKCFICNAKWHFCNN